MPTKRITLAENLIESLIEVVIDQNLTIEVLESRLAILEDKP